LTSQVYELEEEFRRKNNENSRKRLEPEYLEIKNIGIVLIDFVPYKEKNVMIDGLKKIYGSEKDLIKIRGESPFDNIPDIRSQGILSGGARINIGLIYNSDLNWPFYFELHRQLPKCFLYLEVSISQSFDYAYCVEYFFRIKEEYYNKGIKTTFVESGDSISSIEITISGEVLQGEKRKGPDREATIINYQKEAEDFLREYSYGLFLNKTSTLSCPNVEILSMNEIDFKAFKDWYRNHMYFMRFLGTTETLSKLDYFLICFDNDRLFKEYSIFSGLILLASEDHINIRGNLKKDDEIYRRGTSFLRDPTLHLTEILHAIYWSSFHLEITNSDWQEKIRKRFDALSKIPNDNTLASVYTDMIGFKHSFDDESVSEIRNIEETMRELDRYRVTHPAVETLEGSVTINVYESLLEWGKELLDREHRNIEYLSQQFDNFFKFASNLTDINLNKGNAKIQKRMLWITLVTSLIAIAAFFVGLSRI
jgi:hypothetical protein